MTTLNRPEAARSGLRRTVGALITFAVMGGAVTLAPVASASAVTATFATAAVAAAPSTPGSFVPVPLSKVLDTRAGFGAAKSPIAGSGTLTLQVAGLAGVPATAVSAVTLSITAVNPAATGWLTAYATGTAKPGIANLNWVSNRSATATVTVSVSAAGQVNLFNGSASPVDFAVDVEGYYTAGSVTAAGGFVPVTPSRSLDTRNGIGASRSSWIDQGNTLSQALSWQVSGRNGIPASGVTAVVLSLTATNAAAAGFLSAFEDQSYNPGLEFNWNWTTPIKGMAFDAGVPTTNLFVVSLSAAGRAKLNNLGTSDFTHIDVMADVVGYIKGGATAGTGLYQAAAPARLTSQTIAANSTLVVPVDAPPSSSVVLTVAGENAGDWGSVTAYEHGTTRPATAQLKVGPARSASATVVVRVSANSTIDLYNQTATGVDLTVDEYGSFRGSSTVAKTVWSFGTNEAGQLGHGQTSVGSAVPAPISAMTGAKIVASSETSGYAIKADGTLWAWGKNSNDDDAFFGGQLGNGNTSDSSLPVRVLNVANVTAVVAGYEVAYALQADGTVWTWGSGTTGASGDPSNPETASAPVKMAGLANIVSISPSAPNVTAVRADGTVWTWLQQPGSKPTQVAGMSGIKAVDGTSLLRTDGRVQVGTKILVGLSGIVAVSGNYAIKTDGTLWTLAGTKVGGLTSVVTSVGGPYAVTADGSLWKLNGAVAPTRVTNAPAAISVASTGTGLSLVIAA